jgi:hypothetical protein
MTEINRRTVELTDPYLGDASQFFAEECAITELLHEEVLFVNWRRYVCLDNKTIKEETTVLFVSLNDVFYWATADAEALPHDQVRPLYEAWTAKGRWGVVEWACLRRQMRPQTPIERDMRRAMQWSDALEALPPRDPKDCA